MESRNGGCQEARGDGGWEKWEGAGKRHKLSGYRMNILKISCIQEW